MSHWYVVLGQIKIKLSKLSRVTTCKISCCERTWIVVL